jgi:hypothetical protein
MSAGPSGRLCPLALSSSVLFSKGLSEIPCYYRSQEIGYSRSRTTSHCERGLCGGEERQSLCVTWRNPVIVLCWGGIIVRIAGHAMHVRGGFDMPMPMPWGPRDLEIRPSPNETNERRTMARRNNDGLLMILSFRTQIAYCIGTLLFLL